MTIFCQIFKKMLYLSLLMLLLDTVGAGWHIKSCIVTVIPVFFFLYLMLPSSAQFKISSNL